MIQLISIAVLLAQLLAPVARPKPADGNPMDPPKVVSVGQQKQCRGHNVVRKTLETKQTAAGFASRGIPPHVLLP